MPDRLSWRFRLAVCSLGLVAIAFVQDPGRTVADTKLDLVVDPGGFLTRALDLWDPVGFFGQVQNQAYGYLFPMGPFFWLADLASIEPWVVQRLWWSLILITAFLGVVKLCSVLGIGSPGARILAGFAFALSPRMLSIIGPSSIEAWPSALAPWVLVPLVIGTTRGDPRRMAAYSALAVACVGGVNAAATFAVIPLGVCWLLTRPASRRRRSLMLWWPVFTAMGTLWWLIPLVLLGRYSPPFLDYIESASVTSFAGNLVDSLRGVAQWVPYVDSYAVAGRQLVDNPLLILNGTVVLALGVVGLARADLRHRRFLLFGLLAGLVMVTLGHTEPTGGLGSAQIQQQLDGWLAPLRNTHKFDVLIRLPLVLGLAHLVGRVRLASPRRRLAAPRDILVPGVSVLAVVALLGATVPAWTAQLPNRSSFTGIPGYWEETSDWLARQDDGQRALVLPSATFGNNLWGRTNDEALQPLARSPWAVRNTIPLAPGGNIQMLDAIQRRLDTGRGSAGLTSYLRRAGIGYLVVRNDLAPAEDAPNTELLYAALTSSPGITSTRAFGPDVGGGATLTTDDGEEVFVNQGWQAPHPAVEIFEVGDDETARATAQSLRGTPAVIGGPESLLSLDDLGMTAGDPVLLASDVPGWVEPRQVVLTDGQRRREAAFGRVHDNRSSSLGMSDPYAADRPVHDYVVDRGSRWKTVPRLIGADRIEASSSQAYASAPGRLDPSAQPWSAFDGDPTTAWTASAEDAGADASIEIHLDTAVVPTAIAVTSGAPAGTTQQVVVTTDQGRVRARVRGGDRVRIRPVSGATKTVRISGASTSANPLSIDDVDIPGVDLSRPLELPRLPARWGAPDRVVMTSDEGYDPGCIRVSGILRCVAGAYSMGEDGRVLDRQFDLPQGRAYDMRVAVEGLGGPTLDALMQRDRLASVSASSQVAGSPLASVMHAVDGDRETGWIAGDSDSDPTIALNWVGARTISELRVTVDDSLAASAPQEAVLTFPGGRERAVTFRNGLARFRPVETESVSVRFPSSRYRKNLNSDRSGSRLPVGVSEISLPETRLYPQPASGEETTFGCGTGPDVAVSGATFATSVRASPAELLRGGTVQAQLCGAEQVDLRAGSNRVTAQGNGAFRPTSVTLGGTAPIGSGSAVALEDRRWGSSSRLLDLPARTEPTLVTVPENVNPGWDARARGVEAEQVRVDGWQQGWVLPAGAASSLSLRFAPSTTYRAGLMVGLLTLVGLLLVALRRPRRTDEAPASLTAPPSDLPVVLALGIAVALVAGWWGVLAAGLGMLGRLIVEHRVSREVVAWSAGAPVVAAGLAYVFGPWGGLGAWAGGLGWPQLAVVVALGIVAGGACGPRGFRFFRRRNGSSTTR